MPNINEVAITLIATITADDFNVTTTTNLYTVPAGKVFVPFAVLITNASATLASSTVSLGQSGAKTDFLGTQTLSGVNAAGDGAWLMPIPAATSAGIVQYTAGEIFVLDHVAAAGSAATADILVFGIVYDA